MDFQETILREIVEELNRIKPTREKVWKVAKSICKKHRLARVPTNVQILQACEKEEKERLKEFLLMKPIRTVSGVTVITVVAKPESCIWSKCVYCPKGLNAPSSYTGLEPAIQRAIYNSYDPFLQVKNRLWQYQMMGHSVNKIELIIIGGTFLGLEKEYQNWFIKRIFDALNESEAKSLDEAIKMNENAKQRCVNLTIETRPDFCKREHVDAMLSYGVTRVELGAQTIYPDIMEKINRGHTIQDVIDAIRIARDAALKVNLHLMPNLPGSDLDKDLEMFKLVFEDQNFRPDYLKIYPTVVVKGTELYRMWKRGEYKPYAVEELIDLLARVKRFIPKYCRIQRIGRDVPANQIEAGCKRSNLRELVKQRAEELGVTCNCIRCREVGFKIAQGVFPSIEAVELCVLDYEASNGKEIFLSFEDTKNDIILGFLRLRIPEESHRPEISSNTALVRELKVMGITVPVGLSPGELQWQHRGYGVKLLKEAERIAEEEYDRNKIVVLSGVGARQYFLAQGYEYEGPYVSKSL
ncbi:MAG: tRNA uridine(34) 5-carboxymethylaminomethyl modification radical SAM/GNAT enzyme Elp3 [Candidatus Aenigmarchaeota archaeon]|nr:tRNA uridine(34) 5-carboxymethylaminomethyl modification radical SAM/GNAT enzyme Elp3 [Candidatus Aenigmarchaeota archaeon]